MLIFTVLLLPDRSLAGTEREEPAQQTLDQIDRYVREQFESNGVPGGAYAVVYEGSVIAAQGIGSADVRTKEPVTPETVYATASVTKALTATALLKLYERGLVDLDAPVNEYIPWFSYADSERSSGVTIRHLLTHSAGVNRFDADGSIFEDEKKNRDSLENAVRALSTVRMSANPGEKGQYCNSCYNVLGLVMEKVTGKNYEAVMEEELFAPLGMADTFFDPADARHAATEYNWLFGFKHQSASNNAVFGRSQLPEGGIYSNVLDLSKLLSALMNAGESSILSEETARMSQQGEIFTGSEGMKYTIGGFEETSIGHTEVLIKTGDGIGSTAAVLMIPEKKLGVALLIGDSIPEIGGPITVSIARLLLDQPSNAVDAGITFWKLAGLISLGFTVTGVIMAVWLIRSIAGMRKRGGRAIRRWLSAVRGAGFLLINVPIVYLLLTFRPSQIGFYGYPYDIAIGLITLASASACWALYSFILAIRAYNRIEPTK